MLSARRAVLSRAELVGVLFQVEDLADAGEVDPVGDQFGDPAEPAQVVLAVPAGAAGGAGRVRAARAARTAATSGPSHPASSAATEMVYTPAAGPGSLTSITPTPVLRAGHRQLACHPHCDKSTFTDADFITRKPTIEPPRWPQ